VASKRQTRRRAATRASAERARHASGRLHEAITFWIVPRPSNNGSKRGFDIGSLGPLMHCAQ